MFRRTLKSVSTIKATRMVCTSRSYYSTFGTGTFVTLDSRGKPVTEEVKLSHGDPDQSYVLIPPEIGYALQAGIVPSNGISLADSPIKYALTFFHDTKTFAHESSPTFPRLEIPVQLPRQTNTNKSPATLWLAGASHELVLDGTPDAKFAEMSTESYIRLKPILDRLED